MAKKVFRANSGDVAPRQQFNKPVLMTQELEIIITVKPGLMQNMQIHKCIMQRPVKSISKICILVFSSIVSVGEDACSC